MKVCFSTFAAVAFGILQTLPAFSSDGLEVIVQGPVDDLKSALPGLAPELVHKWAAATSELLALDPGGPGTVTIQFTDDIDTPGATLGTTIRISREALKRNPDDHGLLVHELVHALQAYPPRQGPHWITEGIADWIRYFHFEPRRGRAYYTTGEDPTWGRKGLDFTAGYLPAAAFLEYLRREYDPNLLWRLNAELHAGRYRDDFFARRGLADLNALWAEFTAGWSVAAKRMNDRVPPGRAACPGPRPAANDGKGTILLEVQDLWGSQDQRM